MKQKSMSTMASVALAGVFLAGCGAEEEPAATTPAGTTGEEAATTEEQTEDPAVETQQATQAPAAQTTEDDASQTEDTTEETAAAAGGELEGDFTPPGTTLALGETATVPFEYGDGKGVLAFTVTDIEKGEPADLEELDLGDQAAGLTPYYIRITAEGVDESAASLAYSSFTGEFDGLLPDGSTGSTIYLVGDWDKCENTNLPGDFAQGDTVETCLAVAAGGDVEVTSVRYAALDTDYEMFDGEPLLWE